MATDETTVTVDAQQFGEHVPDDRSEIDIGVSAFDDKVYLKFPRFDRSGTNDCAVSADSLFRALIDVRAQNDEITVEPVYRKLGVLTESSVFGHDDDAVRTTRIGDRTEADYVHLSLIEEFTTTIGDVTEDEYWRGYRDGARVGGERLGWDEIAWTAFDNEWSGSLSLMYEAGVWLARKGWAVCSRTHALFPIPEWTAPTGSYVATISAEFGGTCPNCGADKSEHWECTQSSNRTRVPDTYKCTECGHTAQGITTG